MPERISIVTDEISPSLAECEEFLREFRIPAVEIRTVGGRRVPHLSEDDLDRLRAWADRDEWRVLSLSPGLFKIPLEDARATERHLRETLPNSIDLACDLGAEFIITFGFLGTPAAEFPEAPLEALRDAATQCADAGLPLLLENEPGTLAGTAAETLQLLRAVDHTNLFINWDPLNTNEFEPSDLDRGLRALFDLVRHVHVKNGLLKPGESHATCGPLSEGAIDWPRHLQLLKDLGYAHYLGVETHYTPLREASETVVGELRAMVQSARLWP